MTTNISQSNNIPVFDLNINNYTINDLKLLFKLPNNYNLIDLSNSYEKLTTNILQSNQSINKKNKLIMFINKTNKILKCDLENEDDLENKEQTQPESTFMAEKVTNANLLQAKNSNPIGKILLPPESFREPLQKTSIYPNNISGYDVNEISVGYVFNTQFRDNYFNTNPANCTFTLPTKIENVVSIELASLQIPNYMLSFSKIRGTNQLYIKEDVTENSALVVIQDGNFTPDDFVIILTNAINDQVTGGIPRFQVVFDRFTYKITITNTTYTFSMNITTKVFDYDCSLKEHYRLGIPDKEQASVKNPNIPPSALFNSLGYNIGYRNIEYNGEKSYTAEGNYDSTFTDYVYFMLNDYNNNSFDNTIGVLPNFLIKSNLLGVVQLTSGSFTTLFNNTQDGITKSRKYASPVTIKKLSIQVLNQYGEVLDLNLNDYSFCIQITNLYNISPQLSINQSLKN